MTSPGSDDVLAASTPEQRRPPSGPETPPQPEVEPPSAAPVVDAGQQPLTERELAMLDLERKWWRHPGAKEQAIRDRFDLSATRYYQLLNALLDNPAALAHDPVLVGRLRRLRTRAGRPAPGA